MIPDFDASLPRWAKRLPWLLVGLLVAAEIATTVLLPKAIPWDPSYGMLAAQHHLHARSPDMFTIAQADPDDLTRDTFWSPPWWAPAYQGLPSLCRFGILPWGRALSIVIGMSLLVGMSGWGLYFLRALQSPTLAGWLLLTVACARFTLIETIDYGGGDLLLWASAPWLVLINLRALSDRSGNMLAVVAGAASSGIFLLKYSGIFLGFGLGLVWGWRMWRGTVPPRRAIAWGVGGVATGLMIRALGFPAPGHALQPTDYQPLSALLTLGLVPMGATDIESLLAKILVTLHVRGTVRPPAIGLALLAILVAVMFWQRTRLTLSHAARVGAVVAIVNVAILVAAIFMGSNIAVQGRLVRVSRLLLLPIVAAILISGFRENRGIRRWSAVACLAIVLAIPTVNGFAAGVRQITQRFRARATCAGPDFVVCTALDLGTDHEAFQRELQANLPDETTVLYVVYPQFAFPIPERRTIVVEAVELYTAEQLAERRYHGKPRGGVALLLPRTFEHDAKLSAIESSFVDLHNWRFVPLESDPGWALWIAGD